MSINIAIAGAALVLGVVAPVTQASAFGYTAPAERNRPDAPYDALTTGSVGFHLLQLRPEFGCRGQCQPADPSGHAIGQTSGGSRC